MLLLQAPGVAEPKADEERSRTDQQRLRRKKKLKQKAQANTRGRDSDGLAQLGKIGHVKHVQHVCCLHWIDYFTSMYVLCMYVIEW